MTFGRGLPTLAHQGRRWADSAWTRGTSSSARGVQSHCGRRGRHLQLDAASWQTPWMGERIDPPMSQITSPEQVTLAWDGNLSTAGSWSATPEGAVGFPFLPVDISHVAPVADRLFAGLSPECSRLLIGRTGDTLAGWVHIQRNPSPLVARRSLGHHQSSPEPSFFTRPEDRKCPDGACPAGRAIADGPEATSPRRTRRDRTGALLRQARLDSGWPLARCAPASPQVTTAMRYS